MKIRKSRSMRRVKVKVPGGTTRLVYKQRKPKKARCGSCGVILKGVPKETTVKMKNLAKTKKRPQRPYGGVLCSSCLRKLMVQRARSDQK